MLEKLNWLSTFEHAISPLASAVENFPDDSIGQKQSTDENLAYFEIVETENIKIYFHSSPKTPIRTHPDYNRPGKMLCAAITCFNIQTINCTAVLYDNQKTCFSPIMQTMRYCDFKTKYHIEFTQFDRLEICGMNGLKYRIEQNQIAPPNCVSIDRINQMIYIHSGVFVPEKAENLSIKYVDQYGKQQIVYAMSQNEIIGSWVNGAYNSFLNPSNFP